MSGLSKWAALYEFYRQSHRASIVKSLYRRQISKSWPYWMAFVIYLVIGLTAYIVGDTTSLFLLSLLSICATAFSIYIWLEFMIAKEFGEYYQNYGLKQYPFFLRTRYLSYLLFAEKLNTTRQLIKQDVGLLVEWENIRQEKINTFDFFRTPSVLLLLTAFSGLFIEYMKNKNFVQTEHIFLISILLFVVLWIGWTLSDLLNSHKKTNLEICRFLKWWELDKQLKRYRYV